MTVRLAIDLLIAALLVATVCYCFILNRKLGQLRSNQDEMKRLIGEFDQAMAKARVGLSELRGASSEADANLRATLETARTMADELNMMTKSADRLASRLVAHGPIDPIAERKKANAEGDEVADAVAAEVQQAVRAARAHSQPSHQAVAEPVQRAPIPARRSVAAPSSDAERELLNALRRVK